jgi:hypothetical protein
MPRRAEAARRETPKTACGSKVARFARDLFPRPEGSIRLAGLCRLAQDRLWLLPSSSCGEPDVQWARVLAAVRA